MEILFLIDIINLKSLYLTIKQNKILKIQPISKKTWIPVIQITRKNRIIKPRAPN